MASNEDPVPCKSLCYLLFFCVNDVIVQQRADKNPNFAPSGGKPAPAIDGLVGADGSYLGATYAYAPAPGMLSKVAPIPRLQTPAIVLHSRGAPFLWLCQATRGSRSSVFTAGANVRTIYSGPTCTHVLPSCRGRCARLSARRRLRGAPGSRGGPDLRLLGYDLCLGLLRRLHLLLLQLQRAPGLQAAALRSHSVPRVVPSR